MSARLAYSVVLADGSVAEGGTEETPDLRKQITNPAAWDKGTEDDKADEPAKAHAKKSSK